MLDEIRSRLEAELKRVGPDTVAARAGVSRATIYNWITKGNTPLDKLALLTSAGVDTAYVLFGETPDAFIARQQRIKYATALINALPLPELSQRQLAVLLTGDQDKDAALISDAVQDSSATSYGPVLAMNNDAPSYTRPLSQRELDLLDHYFAADDQGKVTIESVAEMAARPRLSSRKG